MARAHGLFLSVVEMNSKWREPSSVPNEAGGLRGGKYLSYIENVLVAVGKILVFPAVLE